MDSVDDGQKAVTLTRTEQALRRRFVEQYLIDFDEYQAVIRLGYQAAFARQYATMFMQEPYTLQLIAEEKKVLGITTDAEVHRKRVLAVLYGVATNQFAPAASKVGAASAIARITGIEAPVKTEVKVESEKQDLSALSADDLKVLQALMAKAKAGTDAA